MKQEMQVFAVALMVILVSLTVLIKHVSPFTKTAAWVAIAKPIKI